MTAALSQGARGLPGGSSLAKLLARHRGVRNEKDLPRLSQRQVLAWADAHHRARGKWPTKESGPIADAPGETWSGVDMALRVAARGLPGGSSLARLLARCRGVRNRALRAGCRGLSGGSSLARLLDKFRHVPNLHGLPRLSVKAILAWADAHHRRTGQWPNRKSGIIPGTRSTTWSAVYSALLNGGRGLTAATSLSRLLKEHGRMDDGD